VVGIDREPGPLATATADARGKGLDNLEFRVGDAYALDFPDDSFDVVHAHQVLQHLTDPVAALTEMRRVCRPGGIVAARDADYAAMTWHPANPLVMVPGPQPMSRTVRPGVRCGIRYAAEFSTVRMLCERSTLSWWPWV
jgi:ubiquinone/menaquinone biosynthesis C-methylase UbiE